MYINAVNTQIIGIIKINVQKNTFIFSLYNITLQLDDPFVETSGSLNLTSPYLEDYFIKMEFKKDFSDLENTVGGGIQVLQGDQNNYVCICCYFIK